MKKKHTIRNIIIWLCVAAAAAGVLYYFYNNNSKQPVDAYPVSLLNSPYWSEDTRYQSVVTNGALQNIELREGLVNSIDVKEGDQVKKGDVVMTYDKTSFQLTLNADESRISLLESQIEKAKREAEKYRTLQPSENEPDSGWEEIIDNGPLEVKSKLTIDDLKAETLSFNCTINSVITKDFLAGLRKLKDFAIINLYDGNMNYGSLMIDGAEIPKSTETYEPYEWPSPTPTVTPEPTPTTEPEPTPTTDPEPTPTTDPEPTPTTDPEPTPTTDPEPTPTTDPEPTPTTDPGPTPTIDPEPTPTADPEPSPAADPVSASAAVKSGRAAVMGTLKHAVISAKKTPTPEPTPQLYIKVKKDIVLEDWLISDIVSYDGYEAEQKPDPDHKYYCMFEGYEPIEYEQYETEYMDSEEDYGENYMYSREELAQMIKEAEKQVTSLQVDLNEARVAYDQDKLIAQSGDVIAAIDGTVSEIRNPDECATGDTIIKIKGNEEFIITVYVSEMDLRDVHIGDKFNITSYESGSNFTTSVREIGTVPASGYFAAGDSNPNNSFYPVSTIAEDHDLELSVGETCDATSAKEGVETTDSLFIPVMFTRSDSRGTYVMKEQNGALAKQYVRTGKTVWGTEIEIRSGLTAADYIAFPYGKTIAEGVPVNKTEELNYYM